MNEETVLETTPETVPVSEPAPTETESTTAATDDWTVTEPVVLETVAQETEAVVLVDVIQESASVVAHVDLFGSFLICGTLVGIFLLRNRHAN